MTDRLADIAQQFADATAEVADLKDRLPKAQARVRNLRPQLAEAIAEDIRTKRRTQVEISRLTGYTPERVRQICRAAGVEPGE
jgi:ABC-type transporter Mla subunit MlaD